MPKRSSCGARSKGGNCCERRIVVGPAPPKRAERAARVKSIDDAAGVLRHLVLVETGEAVNAITARRAFRIAELGEEHALAAERLLQLAEKRHDVGIEPVARERAVDRIAVHRRERPGRRDARRPQAAILLEILAVHSAGRADARASSSASVRRALHSRGIFRRCGLAQIGKLVAEIPSQRVAGWSRTRSADAPRKEDLRAQQLRIGVEIADCAIDDRAAGDGAKPARAWPRARASTAAAS